MKYITLVEIDLFGDLYCLSKWQEIEIIRVHHDFITINYRNESTGDNVYWKINELQFKFLKLK